MTFPPVGSNAATELFNDSVSRAVTRQLPIVDLFKVTATLDSFDQKQLVVDLYKTWIAYNGDDNLLYAVYYQLRRRARRGPRQPRRDQRAARMHQA